MALDKTIKIKVDSKSAEASVNSLDGKMGKLDKSADKTNESFGKLKTTVIAVAAALQVRVIAQYADAFTSIQNQIRQTTTNTRDLTDRTKQLLDVANRSRVEFGATSELYTNLVLSTENLNLSTEEQIRLTETIAKSFAVSGKSAAESAGAIRQLGQAFASGALRGDEFNSIAEGAPEIMRALQRSLNLTQGQLRDFAATGGITSKVLVDALGGAADVIDIKMSKASQTFSQAAQEAENNAIAFVGSSDLITTSMGFAGESIITLSENLDVLANVALVAAAVGYGRLSAALILNTVETVKNTVAKAASVPVTARVNNGINFTTKNVQASTVAMRASRVAAVSLRGAMSLLGGPIGVVALAATALLSFALNADDAEDKADKLAQQVDTLAGSFSNLTKAQIEPKLQNAVVEVNKLEKSIAQTSAKITELKTNKFSIDTVELGRAVTKLEELERALDEAIVKRDALFEAGLSAGRTPESGSGEKSSSVAPKEKEKDLFVNTEISKTQELRSALEKRRTIQTAYNNLLLQDFKSLADQERAIAEFRRQEALAELQQQIANAEIEALTKRENLVANDRLTFEQRFELEAELQQQELTQKQLFELQKTQIEEDAASDRAAIARNEYMDKVNAAQTWATATLSINELFGSKSEKANKRRRKTQARIDGAAGIVRAWAENDFYSALAMTVAIAASTEAQIKRMDSAGGGGGGGSASFNAPAPRQEPVRQSNVVEIGGLSEAVSFLRERDPDEPIPMEVMQRFVIGMDEYNRVSGGG
jgi:tape measure domain-containing protein